MPAARQRTRSSGMAWAVTAITGTLLPAERMAWVAVYPSITGISQSMRISRVIVPGGRAHGFAPVGHRMGPVTKLVQLGLGNDSIDAVVFGNQDQRSGFGRLVVWRILDLQRGPREPGLAMVGEVPGAMVPRRRAQESR